MKVIGMIASPLLSALGIFKQKSPHVPQPSPVPTRDDAAAQADRITELTRRRGGAADMMTGAYGAEAVGGTGKTTLGS
jgi:hypothetical protein